MKKTYSLILFFCLKIIVGQNDSLKIYKNQIKFSPTRLITDIRGFQINYERQTSTRLSSQIQATYIFDPLANTNFSTWKKMNGSVCNGRYFRATYRKN